MSPAARSTVGARSPALALDVGVPAAEGAGDVPLGDGEAGDGDATRSPQPATLMTATRIAAIANRRLPVSERPCIAVRALVAAAPVRRAARMRFLEAATGAREAGIRSIARRDECGTMQ